MTIWVDSDSCPVRVREIISKASFRLSILTVFVANRKIPKKEHVFIKSIITSGKEQAADEYILCFAKKGDLVITRDIPLASQLVEKDISVINDRGRAFTTENIRTLLSMRNFMYEANQNGLMIEKTSNFGKKEVQMFSNTFDAILTKLLKQNQ